MLFAIVHENSTIILNFHNFFNTKLFIQQRIAMTRVALLAIVTKFLSFHVNEMVAATLSPFSTPKDWICFLLQFVLIILLCGMYQMNDRIGAQKLEIQGKGVPWGFWPNSFERGILGCQKNQGSHFSCFVAFLCYNFSDLTPLTRNSPSYEHLWMTGTK
jgi:hypothetical protein